jgi:hypothetical protein
MGADWVDGSDRRVTAPRVNRPVAIVSGGFARCLRICTENTEDRTSVGAVFCGLCGGIFGEAGKNDRE